MSRHLWLVALFVAGFAFSVFARRSKSLDTTEFYVLLIAIFAASSLILYAMRRNPRNEDDP